MTILTILLFISCILFLIGYRKERSRRIALESEVRSFADRKVYDINKLLEGAKKALKKDGEVMANKYGSIFAPAIKMNKEEFREWCGEKPKAMTAPIVRDHPLANDSAMTAPIVKFKSQGNESQKDLDIEKLLQSDICTNPKHKEHLPKIPRGYKRHDGGKMPVNYMQWVDIIQRNGEREVAKARMFDWSHDDIMGDTRWADIVAYKPIKPTKKQTKKPKTMKRKKK